MKAFLDHMQELCKEVKHFECHVTSGGYLKINTNITFLLHKISFKCENRLRIAANGNLALLFFGSCGYSLGFRSISNLNMMRFI